MTKSRDYQIILSGTKFTREHCWRVKELKETAFYSYVIFRSLRGSYCLEWSKPVGIIALIVYARKIYFFLNSFYSLMDFKLWRSNNKISIKKWVHWYKHPLKYKRFSFKQCIFRHFALVVWIIWRYTKRYCGNFTRN